MCSQLVVAGSGQIPVLLIEQLAKEGSGLGGLLVGQEVEITTRNVPSEPRVGLGVVAKRLRDLVEHVEFGAELDMLDQVAQALGDDTQANSWLAWHISRRDLDLLPYQEPTKTGTLFGKLLNQENWYLPAPRNN